MKSFIFVLLTVLMFAASSATAADAEAGETKAVVCAACHGATGVSINSLWPNLAGQQEQYLAKQMKDFRNNNRQDPLMSPMAAVLSDDDIANLAAFYADL